MALLGSGASSALQVPPDWVSMRPCSLFEVSKYPPTLTQVPVVGHEVPKKNGFAGVVAPLGMGASMGLNPAAAAGAAANSTLAPKAGKSVAVSANANPVRDRLVGRYDSRVSGRKGCDPHLR